MVSARRPEPAPALVADMFAERNAQADLDTIVRQFLALKAPDAADHYSSVKCPSIILSGSEDSIHKSAFVLKEQIPNCEMRVLHRAGHACQMEQPWLFDRYMIEFLKDHGLFPVSR
jgi:pimeloyl-ACP methyl ester carboxylesterase